MHLFEVSFYLAGVYFALSHMELLLVFLAVIAVYLLLGKVV
jgi:hypothetical protein